MRAMKNSIVVEANELSKIFGEGHLAVRAVDRVNLKIHEGEIILIMGPSGSGKTTLLSILGALLKPTDGKVEINGIEITKLNEGKLPGIRVNNIGFIFQSFNLLSSASALENVVFPLSLSGKKSSANRKRARKLLEDLGLGNRLNYLPKNLSGGEKQRVSIARALINDPRLILADEPTANLDSKSGHEVMMLLHDIAKKQKKTVVIVSHDMRIMDIADRVLQLEDGRLAEGGIFLVEDPVCGMRIPKEKAVARSTYEGKTYYFCSKTCQEKFKKNPQIFF